jgi:hypothetical protein
MLKKFTVLRDPIERTISHYYHVRRAPDHPFHHWSLQLDLHEFCNNPVTRHMVENYQAAYLSTMCLTPWGSSRRASPQSSMQIILEMGAAQTKSNEWLLAVAEDALSQFEAVGITERLNDSLALFASRLGVPVNGDVTTLHVNEGNNRLKTSELNPRTIEVIRGLTAVDQELHNAVAKRLNQWGKLNEGATDCCMA